MAFIFSPFADVVGGKRPAIFEYLSGPAWATGNDGSTALVLCNPTGPENGLINGDPDLAILNPSAYARFGIPDNGARDEKEVVDWVTAVLLLRQLVPGLPNDLTGKFEGQTPAIMAKLKAAHTGRKPLDTGQARTSRSLGTVIQSLAEQLIVRTEPSTGPRKHGTFEDGFSGEASQTALASHTPDISGTAWTLTAGSGAQFNVETDGTLSNSSETLGFVACDDQGSPDQYVEYDRVGVTYQDGGALAYRSDGTLTNYWRSLMFSGSGGSIQVQKTVGGVGPTAIITITAEPTAGGETIRVEADSADAHEVFSNGVSIGGPATDAALNTLTRQGLAKLGAVQVGTKIYNRFEAGPLAAAPAASTGSGHISGLLGFGVGRLGIVG